MSSYIAKFIRKSDGEVLDVWCIDDYFGRRQYGYLIGDGSVDALTEDEFYKLFDNIEENV